ncbi:hypothetical protein [Streptomyces venezuelae]
MRVRITDGTREVDIRCDDAPTRPGRTPSPTLTEVEDAARRLMQAMTVSEAPHANPVGFTVDTSLDSTTERSDQDQYEASE